MKTTEDWLEEMFGRGNWATVDTVTVNALRLEAFKAGMERAALECNLYAGRMRGAHVNTNNSSFDIKKAILDAAQQLTQLP